MYWNRKHVLIVSHNKVVTLRWTDVNLAAD